MSDRIPETFLMMSIQHWGQSADERKIATDAYLKEAGFNLGADRAAADEWLKGVLQNLRRGEFHDEVSQLRSMMLARAAVKAA